MAIAAALLAIARPLLFASIDAPLALARGVPVRALGLAFLALLGLDAAEATQAVGALLLLGLLAAPAGAALRLTANPYRGLALSALIALAAMWVGLALADWIGTVPPGSAVILVAIAFYCGVALWDGRACALRGACGRRPWIPSRGDRPTYTPSRPHGSSSAEDPASAWADRAEAALAAAGRKRGGARRALLLLLGEQTLRAHRRRDRARAARALGAAGEPRERLPDPRRARARAAWWRAWRPGRRWCATSARTTPRASTTTISCATAAAW